MTSNQPKSAPQSVLLVFGKPTSADLAQASWFHVEDRARVIASAQNLQFTVLDVQTGKDSSLLDGVHEGVLKGTGRMIVGSVTREVYKRIEEHAAKTTGALAVAPTDTAEAPKATSEQNKNVLSAVESEKPATATNPWETLRVGSRVLAAYWGEGQEFEGFWLATVKRIESGEFTLEWLEEPEYPPFKAVPKNLAVPHPEFRPTLK